MPAAYSLDLRKKVMQAIEEGMSISNASRTFKVSRNSIYLWQKRLQEQGSLEATTGYHNPHNRQIKDLSHFAEFVSSRRDWTQQELGDAYGVSAKVVGRALKKLGWTRKKSLSLSRKR
jgi:transposase